MEIDGTKRLIRVRSLASPYFFVKTLLKNPDMDEKIHGGEMEKLVERMKLGYGYRYKWIEWFRGALKSTCFTQGFSVWMILPEDEHDRRCAIDRNICSAEEWDARSKLRNQNYAQLIAFETATNSGKKLNHIRTFFESYDLFRECFPEIAYTGEERPWNDSAICIRRDAEKHIPPDPTFESKGVGGALQSGHYDVIWTDDIVGKDAIESDLVMEKTKSWFGQLNGVEQLGGRTWRFGVSNRWGFNDLNSYLALNEPHWDFSRLDAYTLNEAGERVPTWPEQYPLSVLDQKLASMSDDEFYCQYLNDPRVPGGAELNPERIHLWKITGDDLLECSCGGTYSPSSMNRYMHYDPYSAKGRRSRSTPAIVVVGTTTDKHVFLLQAYTKKRSYDQVFSQLFKMNTMWNPMMFTYEDVGAQNMTAQYLKEYQKGPEFTERKYRPFKRIVGVTTGGKPLEIRIRDYLIPVIEKGKFSVNEKHQLMFDMAKTFPHDVPGHDYDLLDALAQGAKVWKYPMDADREDKFKEEEQRYLKKMGQGYTKWAATA